MILFPIEVLILLGDNALKDQLFINTESVAEEGTFKMNNDETISKKEKRRSTQGSSRGGQRQTSGTWDLDNYIYCDPCVGTGVLPLF